MKIGTQYYLVYIMVLKWLELKIIVKCWKLLVKLRFFGFVSFFGTFAHKVVQAWFILHETWHNTLFGLYCYVEMVGIENHIHMLEITS